MNILCHRGFWLNIDEKNSATAFKRAFDLGLGTETDIRDLNGEIVISHDPPLIGAMTFGELLNLTPKDLLLALNVKSDGIAEKALFELKKANHTNFFFFDMSVPDMQLYIKLRLPIAARCSEYEPLVLGSSSQSNIIWLDMFKSQWYVLNDIVKLLDAGMKVYIVSAELQGMDNHLQWELLEQLKFYDGITLCTDHPLKAIEYFS